MPRIEIYPDHPRPPWARVGATCRNSGDGDDLYTISAVLDRAVVAEDGVMSFAGIRQWPIPVPPGVPDVGCALVWADPLPAWVAGLRTWGDRPLNFRVAVATILHGDAIAAFSFLVDLPRWEDFALADGRTLVVAGYEPD